MSSNMLRSESTSSLLSLCAQKNLKPRNRRAQMNSNILSILFVFFFTFYSKESIIINIETNFCFVLQTKNSVKKIISVKVNFDFYIREQSFFAMELIWRSEKITVLNLVWI